MIYKRGDDKMVITVSDVLVVIRKIVDISLVWFIFYYILKNIKNNVKLSLIFKGVAFVIILKLISDWLGFITVGYLLDYIIQWGPVALIIIFQPEIRTILEQLGRSQLLGRHKVLTVDERERMVYEKLYADLSSDLLIAIFYEGNPLHDGGVIIQGDRVTCAGAVFPTSNSSKINRRLGTRHRAALGLAEETDAICIVVSEETGRVSIALKGELLYNLTLDDVRMLLIDELKPKNDIDYEEEIDEEEIYEENR